MSDVKTKIHLRYDLKLSSTCEYNFSYTFVYTFDAFQVTKYSI